MKLLSLAGNATHWLLNQAAPRGSWRRQILARGKRAWKDWLVRAPQPSPAVGTRPVDALPAAQGHAAGDLWRWAAADAEVDELGAARCALGLLRDRPDLRQRFPRGITAGWQGDYGRWLRLAAAHEFAWTSQAVAHLQAAFAWRLGDRVRQLYEHRQDLQQLFPLALMPPGRRPFVTWLLQQGQPAHQLRDEEIRWFEYECAEDPYQGVVATFLRNPDWQQRFPHGLTRWGYAKLLAWIRQHYGLEEEWLPSPCPPDLFPPADELRLFYLSSPELQQVAPQAFRQPEEIARLAQWLQAKADPGDSPGREWWRQVQDEVTAELRDGLGVNILGHFCFPSGLQVSTRSLIRSLHRVGVRTSCRDVPVHRSTDEPNRLPYLGPEVFDISLIHVQPEPFFATCYSRSGLAPRPDTYRIAFWYWELEEVPAEWARVAESVQEVWAPTRFVAGALQRVLPVPVFHILPGVELEPFAPLPRDHFGLAPDRFTFLFMFNMQSIMARKNPLALIRAFRQAFPADERAALVIKVTWGQAGLPGWEQLYQAAQQAGVTLINRVLSTEETCGLIDACDCYVSLHRSEGYGLPLAEALLMGKPVIATGYSGNLDFMSPANSLLVDYERVPVEPGVPVYQEGCLWAEPSVDQAAAYMRWVFEHPLEARALGARAQQELRTRLSLEAAGRRMQHRLREIQASRGRTALC